VPALRITLLVGLVLVVGCQSPHNSSTVELPPSAPREFRAVWVATVANIDWPSKPGLSTADQHAEAIAILDRCKELNMNAVVLQVRPCADALYESRLEPWSYFLTGQQGKAPQPYYDPLKFWIDQAHARGLELHAWFNPLRARQAGAKYEESDGHISKRRPDLVRKYGTMLWLDPGEEEARRHSVQVFVDVARRYDVDGIHIDDYFYPYPVTEKVESPATASADAPTTQQTVEVPFPDDNSWNRYVSAGGKLSRDDWRRDNISRMVQSIYQQIKRTKKHVKFGISPFGIPKPSLRPAGITGFSQYDKLYADAEKWLAEGWCDYWTPQLYWRIDRKGQEFPKLVDYWISQNVRQRNFWPGLFTGRVGDGEQNWPADEIIKQIEITRQHGEKSNGQVHFSMKVLMRDRDGIVGALKAAYPTPALVPASPWLDNRPPARPRVTVERASERVRVAIRPGWGEKPARYAIWKKYGEEWSFDVLPASTTTFTAAASQNGQPLRSIAVAAVDRCGNESEWAIVKP